MVPRIALCCVQIHPCASSGGTTRSRPDWRNSAGTQAPGPAVTVSCPLPVTSGCAAGQPWAPVVQSILSLPGLEVTPGNSGFSKTTHQRGAQGEGWVSFQELLSEHLSVRLGCSEGQRGSNSRGYTQQKISRAACERLHILFVKKLGLVLQQPRYPSCATLASSD